MSVKKGRKDKKRKGETLFEIEFEKEFSLAGKERKGRKVKKCLKCRGNFRQIEIHFSLLRKSFFSLLE